VELARERALGESVETAQKVNDAPKPSVKAPAHRHFG
jgi:hypothetical protein